MRNLVLGNRIPYEYFITSGKGQSNVHSEGLPYETGSYDAALTNAGIENANIVQYTSVMPKDAKEITLEEGISRMQWGEVIESIKAEQNGQKGEFISAAVMTTSVYDPRGKYLGGFACEYAGHGIKQQVEKNLEDTISGIIERRGYGTIKNGAKMYRDNKTDKGYIIHPGVILIYDSLKVQSDYGTVIAAICFVSYHFPVLRMNKSRNTRKNMSTIHTNRKRRRTLNNYH